MIFNSLLLTKYIASLQNSNVCVVFSEDRNHAELVACNNLQLVSGLLRDVIPARQ